jgi:hypothetical protein
MRQIEKQPIFAGFWCAEHSVRNAADAARALLHHSIRSAFDESRETPRVHHVAVRMSDRAVS